MAASPKQAACRGTDAGPLRRPAQRAVRECWARERQRLTWWRLAFLGVLGGLAVASVLDRPYSAAITAWILAGSLAWIASIAGERDRACRIRRHETSGLPAIGGWRLKTPLAEASPPDLLALDLITWLYDHARLEARPIRGHPRGRTRVTYAGGGLRALSRQWATQTGAPVRLGDRTLARLRALGVVRGVRISQVVAHRLVFVNAEDAIRAMERSSSRQLIDWELGRDPRAFESDRPDPLARDGAPARAPSGTADADFGGASSPEEHGPAIRSSHLGGAFE